ncbi:MAG: hypothetical protein J3Q66DRAFT_382767 [Benniella sp.]|nr:MAG: hypothetical protein J3Q66DRAFT_382767 [Benniella sp.]
MEGDIIIITVRLLSLMDHESDGEPVDIRHCCTALQELQGKLFSGGGRGGADLSPLYPQSNDKTYSSLSTKEDPAHIHSGDPYTRHAWPLEETTAVTLCNAEEVAVDRSCRTVYSTSHTMPKRPLDQEDAASVKISVELCPLFGQDAPRTISDAPEFPGPYARTASGGRQACTGLDLASIQGFLRRRHLEHAVLKDLVDISGMVSAFGAASYIEVEPVTTHPCDPIAQPSPSAPLPAPLVDNARSLLSPSSSSSSSAAAPAAPHPVGTITQPSPSSSSSSSAPHPHQHTAPIGTITQPPSSVPSQLLQSPLATTSRSSRPSRSSKAARTSGDSSNNGNDSLGSVALAKMKYQFDMNFSAYQGLPWRLPSGSVVDDVVARLARQDGYESGLQSCVLEDPSKIIALFPAQGDKDELRRVLVERPEEALATLTDHEQAFVDSFGKSPEDVELMLGQGWANLPGGAELDVDFKMLVHHCFQQLY